MAAYRLSAAGAGDALVAAGFVPFLVGQRGSPAALAALANAAASGDAGTTAVLDAGALRALAGVECVSPATEVRRCAFHLLANVSAGGRPEAVLALLGGDIPAALVRGVCDPDPGVAEQAREGLENVIVRARHEFAWPLRAAGVERALRAQRGELRTWAGRLLGHLYELFPPA